MEDFGPDVRFIDQALAATFTSYAIDPEHVAIAGFSDGASYALSLGLSNGDVFSHVLAFSPGFMAPASVIDSPPVFITHGIRDEVLPIDPCSRRIVEQLRRIGFPVEYHEFPGGHTIPPGRGFEAYE
jgi:predicted esterase